MKCRCRLDIVPVEIDPGCYWHAPKVLKDGRWRCPVCNHWVDKNAGWRVTPEEEVCGQCYLILKGGKPEKPGPSQWTPR